MSGRWAQVVDERVIGALRPELEPVPVSLKGRKCERRREAHSRGEHRHRAGITVDLDERAIRDAACRIGDGHHARDPELTADDDGVAASRHLD